LKRGIQIVQSR